MACLVNRVAISLLYCTHNNCTTQKEEVCSFLMCCNLIDLIRKWRYFQFELIFRFIISWIPRGMIDWWGTFAFFLLL
jgi:hypothetical protein